MLSRVQSFVLAGIDALPCEVEIDLAESGFPREQIVGLPDAAVKESLERVRSAVINAGFAYPQGRRLINLAPAENKKEGPVYDLPIAVGLLTAAGVIPTGRLETDGGEPRGIDPRDCLIAGELALDGRLRPIKGAISMAALARSRGAGAIIVPEANAPEAAVVQGVDVYGARTLAEVVGLLNGLLPAEPHPPVDVATMLKEASAPVDFAEIRGQEGVKRAITVAAAGGHNLLMIGPAGTGKTMMAKALPGVLPTMTPEEALEVTRIYSAAGMLSSNGESGLVSIRPVRSPHHTASAAAIIGGGKIPKPGEVTLAHRGVLFLDEAPEFPRTVLDAMRQPLEDREITIARAHSSLNFPASFMLVMAMNPTPKGGTPTDEYGKKEMERYLGRLSGPLVDRVDIHVEAPAVPWKKLAGGGPPGTSSAEIRDRVLRAREAQRSRQGNRLNAALRGKDLDGLAAITEEAKSLLGQAITELKLSARAYDKLRRVSRTIADLEGEAEVGPSHVAEAVQYRLLDRG